MAVPKRIIRRFDSASEFIRFADEKRDRHNGSATAADEHFTGTRDFAHAMELATHGWSEVRPQVDAMLKPLREKLADKLANVVVRQHDLIGFEPDIDRFLAGEIECMWDEFTEEVPKEGNVYTVLVSGSVNAGVSAETVLRRGTVLVAMVEAFTLCGAELEVWIENSVTSYNRAINDDSMWSSLVRVHKAGDPLDIDAVMFPLAHPSWQRRFSFAVRESEARDVRSLFGFERYGGYGTTADLLCVDAVDGLSFTLTRGGTMGEQMDKDPLAFVLGQLEAQGIYEPVS